MKNEDCSRSCLLKWEIDDVEFCIADLMDVPANECHGTEGIRTIIKDLIAEKPDSRSKIFKAALTTLENIGVTVLLIEQAKGPTDMFTIHDELDAAENKLRDYYDREALGT